MARATKVPERGRLVWYDQAATPDYWLEHWRGWVAKGLLDEARSAPIDDDELGRMFRPHLTARTRVIEAGCGPGWWVANLQANGCDAEGIDFSAALVDMVREADPTLPVHVGDALDIDRPNGTYDVYLSIGVVEHRRDGPEPFLVEAHRVLAPDGVAVIAVPSFGPLRRLRARLGTYDQDADPATFYQYGFSRRELEGLVAASGFTILSSAYYAARRATGSCAKTSPATGGSRSTGGRAR